jgi:hypothetical protein
MDVNDYIKTLSTEDVEFRKRFTRDQIKLCEEQLKDLEESWDFIEAELDRREREAFWQLHPEWRMEVGDKVLITQSFIDDRQRTVKQGHLYRKGDVWKIEGFSFPSAVRIVDDNISLVYAPIDLVLEMRRAYLAQHPDSEPL